MEDMNGNTFQSLCRLCAMSKAKKIRIFESVGKAKQLLDKIHICLAITIHEDDELPKSVCEDCFLQVERMSDFRDVTLKAKEHLMSLLERERTEKTKLGAQDVEENGDEAQDENAVPMPLNVMIKEELTHTDEEEEQILEMRNYLTDKHYESNERVINEEELIINKEEMISDESNDAGYMGYDYDNTVQGVGPEHPAAVYVPREQSEASRVSWNEVPVEVSSAVLGPSSLSSIVKSQLYIDPERERLSSESVNHQVNSPSCADDISTKNSEIFVSTKDEESIPKISSEISSKCTTCKHVFDSLNVLKTHLSRFHLGKDLINERNIYNESFSIQDNLIRHLKDICMRRYRGDYCYQDYSGTGLRDHLKAVFQHNIHQPLSSQELGHHKRSETYSDKTLAEDSELLRSVQYEEVESKVNSEYSVKCICDKVFLDRESLNTHQRLFHTKSNRYSCDICNKSFNFKSILRTHLERHMGVKRKCHHCNKLYSQPGLCYHLRALRNHRPHRCPLCSKSYPLPSQLKFHLDTKHKQGIAQSCERCEKVFYGTRHLKIHLKTHIKSDASCKGKHNRHSEETSKHSVSCRECGMSYNYIGNLYKHFKKKHGEKLKDIPKGSVSKYIVKEKERSLICEYCAKVFRDYEYFQYHLKSHLHGQQKHACSVCDKEYSLKSILRKHIRRNHRSEQDQLICEYCGKVFRHKHNFQSHVRSHRQKPVCTYCGKEYRFKNSLQRHIRLKHSTNQDKLC